jgi:mRNA-degrading endonuclease RelE of RelBE toxin-antitoxin system
MGTTISISVTAVKQIRKLPADMQTAVRRAIRTLEDWPDVRNVKNLTGIQGYRLRVGRYRVLFDVSDDGTILIAQVLIRNERTY